MVSIIRTPDPQEWDSPTRLVLVISRIDLRGTQSDPREALPRAAIDVDAAVEHVRRFHSHQSYHDLVVDVLNR